jgi:hypothetical protein
MLQRGKVGERIGEDEGEEGGKASAAAHGHPSSLNPFMVSLRRIISIS